MLGNLVLKDAVVSSKLFKFGTNLLKLLLTLFVNGHFLVNKLLHKIFKLDLGWVELKAYCFTGNPYGFYGLAFRLNGGFICEDVFDHENLGWFLHWGL